MAFGCFVWLWHGRLVRPETQAKWAEAEWPWLAAVSLIDGHLGCPAAPLGQRHSLAIRAEAQPGAVSRPRSRPSCRCPSSCRVCCLARCDPRLRCWSCSRTSSPSQPHTATGGSKACPRAGRAASPTPRMAVPRALVRQAVLYCAPECALTAGRHRHLQHLGQQLLIPARCRVMRRQQVRRRRLGPRARPRAAGSPVSRHTMSHSQGRHRRCLRRRLRRRQP